MKHKSVRRGAWRTVTAMVSAASLLAVTGCGGSEGSSGGGKEPIKIGLLTGMTGAYASYGEPQKQAAELYVKRHPKINGHPVKLTVVDSQSDEGSAVNQFRKLSVEEQVHAVVGPSSSGESIALRPFSKQMKTPTMALASSDDIIQPSSDAKYMFKEYTGTQDSITAQMQFAKDKGWGRVALLYTNDGYGQDAKQRMGKLAKSMGVTVTDQEAFDSSATDVTAQLNKIQSGEPDVVLVWAGSAASQAVVAKSANSINFKPQIFGSPGAGSPDYLKSSGSAANGNLIQGSVVLAADDLDKDNPMYEATRTFVDEYKKEYGTVASQYAANCWDGMTLVYNAIEQAGDQKVSDLQGTRDAIRDSLEANTKDVEGVNSLYSFTEDYHGSKGLAGLAVLKVDGGKLKIVKTYE